MKWYRKAAEQGDAYAQYSLSFAYITGQGAIKDEVEGLAWYYVGRNNDSNMGETFINAVGEKIRTAENQLDTLGKQRAQKRATEIMTEISARKSAR